MVKKATRTRRPPKPIEAPPEIKIGRPRTADGIRIARGVRLDPQLIARADNAVRQGFAGARNFTQAVECALTDWLHDFDSGTLARKPAKRVTA